MGKGSNHPFSGEKVFFATKHSKEVVLQPILSRIGLECIRADVDTDKFGTFSGEVERVGTVRETLRLKTAAAAKANPEGRFFLASEGSFGPHLLIGFIQGNHEALLFVDKKLDIEIYVDELSTETNHAELEIGPQSEFNFFLKQIGFPEHGLIVKPKGTNSVVFKNLKNLQAAEQAIIKSFQVSPEAKVILSTDMRAHFNPTRMKIIEKAGQKLAKALTSLCPACQTPGFAISKGIPGLPCEECGEPSRVTKDVIWSCVSCRYAEQKERPDGLRVIPASDCEACNP